MKTQDLLLWKSNLFLVLAILCPLFLTQCKTTGGSYKQIEYDPVTLKTPSGHGLEKKDYPFDDEGNYRKDWVKNKSRGKVRSASKLPETAPSSSSTADAGINAAAPSSYPGYAGPAASTPAPAPPPPAPAPPAAPSSPKYHKVSSGDTLFSLSRKYGTSVSELKRINGLTGDGIRTGQQLRLP